MIRSPTLSAWCAVNAPAWRSIASTRVVFPWSTCATMATLRRFADFSSGTRVNFTVRARLDPHPRPGTVAGHGYREVMPSIATNTRVGRDELLDFVRTRHHLLLV